MLSKKQKDWWLAEAFSSEAQAVFDLMPTDPPPALKNAMAIFIDSQVASGNFALLDVFQFYGMDTEANALIDWIGTIDAINVNSTTFVANNFFSPDGATKYINAGFTPTIHGSNFVRNSAVLGAYLVANRTAGNKTFLGELTSTPGTRRDYVRKNAGNIIWQVNADGNEAFAADYIDESLYLIFRTGSVTGDLFRNAVSIDPISDASLAPLSDKPSFIGALNNDGSAAEFTDCDVACFVAGGGAGFDQSNFFNNLLIMLQTLGII